MNSSVIIQKPFPARRDNLETVIKHIVKRRPWERVSLAVAYCTVSGARLLYESVRNKCPEASFRWLLGLDDYITQPGAIEFCRSQPRGEVRLYSSKKANSRFHPKMLLMHTNTRGLPATLLVGSANLTFAALSKNCEAVARIDAATGVDARQLHDAFEGLWRLGRRPTRFVIARYTKEYEQHRKLRKNFTVYTSARRSRHQSHEVLKSDVAERDPGTAQVCWIEVGKNTALGHELEFKAEQALFFGCKPGGGRSRNYSFVVSNGEIVNLRMKYQKANSMWRLQMTHDVPEVAKGLRPYRNGRLGRSPFAAIITRTGVANQYRLAFVRVGSKQHLTIRIKSQRLGTVGSTTSREYGWY